MHINKALFFMLSLFFFKDSQAEVGRGDRPFIACHTQYESKLMIATPKSYLDQVIANNIDIVERNVTPIIYLSNHTKVKGNITFTRHAGLVILDTSSIIVGTVINGLVAAKDFPSLCKGG